MFIFSLTIKRIFLLFEMKGHLTKYIFMYIRIHLYTNIYIKNTVYLW